MRALPLAGCIVLAAASNLAAQVPSADVQIAGAVSAAPEDMRKDATVIGYTNYHRMAVLRQGTGEMVCLADDPSAASWHVACYHKDLDPFMAMGRELEEQGKTSQEIKDARRAAIKAGTIKMPEGPRALYNLYAPAESIDVKTGLAKSPEGLQVVYIPYATEETTGLPTKPEKGTPWIMGAGEPWAHIMIVQANEQGGRISALLERPIEQACFWLAQRRPSQVTIQQGKEEATVVVVGGGLTGLWTALFLRELDPSAQVVVLEQEQVAYGASGRNAGMLSETVDHSHSLAVAHFGAREAALLARIGESNVAELIEFLSSRGLNCDFEPTGRIVMALTPAQVEDARNSVESANELGIHSFRLIDRDEAQAELHSPLYQGGVAVSGGGILDPVKLVDALRQEAERLGVRVYEKSAVRSFQSNGAGVVVETGNGTVGARKVVLATSAYTHQLLPTITRRFIPLYDYVLVSAPLTASQWEALGWKGRQGITDGRTFFNYYRPTADGRVLWGTSEATYYSGNVVGPSCDHSARHYQSLRDSWNRHFPAVSDMEWEYAWGGAICSTTRMTPFFGSALGGRVHYGLGYTGHGLGTTRLAGRILAHQALDRPSELLDLSLVKKKPFPYPPEPMRSWAVNAVTRGLRRVDAGEPPNLLLRVLERMGIGFSS